MFKYDLDQKVYINIDNKLVKATVIGRKYVEYNNINSISIKYDRRCLREDKFEKLYLFGDTTKGQVEYILLYGTFTKKIYNENEIYKDKLEAIGAIIANSEE